MNQITIELCQEDRARLDRILDALEKRPACDRCVESAVRLATNAPQEAADAPVPAATPEPAQDIPAEQPAAVETPTVAQLQKKVSQVIAAGMKADAKAVIKSYADSISDVPEDKRAEAIEQLERLLVIGERGLPEG